MNNTISEIKSRLNIIDLISEYLPLKKAGMNYRAPCPFHHEKTPSFFVSEEKQLWHCFGCGAGGDLFEFFMKIEGMEFKEALNILAKRTGVPLEFGNRGERDQRSVLYQICYEAAVFFNQKLFQSPHADIARNYLKKRGVKDKTAQEFCVGYSPHSWNELKDYLLKKGFPMAEIANAGLIVKSARGNDFYDRFRNRVMFPIWNHFGEIAGFSARVLNEAEDKMGKYINTPETPIFKKSALLYGLFQGKESIKQEKMAIFVEGQMDVVSCHQAGWKNVVATSGTAMTEEHIRLIKRYTACVGLCFDTDRAGLTAMMRATKLFLAQDLNAKVIKVIGGKDPDEAIQKDPRLFHTALDNAKDLLDFYFESVIGHLDPRDGEAKRKAVSFLLKLLSYASNGVLQTHYLQRLSSAVDISEPILREEMKKLQNKEKSGLSNQNRSEPSAAVQFKRDQVLVERLLALLLKDQSLFQNIPEDFEALLDAYPFEVRLYRFLKSLYAEKKSPLEGVVYEALKKQTGSDGRSQFYLDRLILLKDYLYSEFSAQDLAKERGAIIKELEKLILSDRLLSLQRQLRSLESQKNGNGGDDAASAIMREIYKISQKIKA